MVEESVTICDDMLLIVALCCELLCPVTSHMKTPVILLECANEEGMKKTSGP